MWCSSIVDIKKDFIALLIIAFHWLVKTWVCFGLFSGQRTPILPLPLWTWTIGENYIYSKSHSFYGSVAGFELILARKMTFYVITYYLPSGLFVVVSWISFLVNPECIPGNIISIPRSAPAIKERWLPAFSSGASFPFLPFFWSHSYHHQSKTKTLKSFLTVAGQLFF